MFYNKKWPIIYFFYIFRFRCPLWGTSSTRFPLSSNSSIFVSISISITYLRSKFGTKQIRIESGTKCNSLSPLLIDIVRFSPLSIVVNFTNGYERKGLDPSEWYSVWHRHVLKIMRLTTIYNELKWKISTSSGLERLHKDYILNYNI